MANRPIEFVSPCTLQMIELVTIERRTNIDYASEEFHNILLNYSRADCGENDDAAAKNKAELIEFIIESRRLLIKCEEFYTETTRRIFEFFLTIDKRAFTTLTYENIYNYTRKFLFNLKIHNDVNTRKHGIHMLALKVLAKYSINNDNCFKLFCEDSLYCTISAIVSLIIDEIHKHGGENRTRLLETLAYCLYLLFMFSHNSKLYLKQSDREKLLIQVKTILIGYLDRSVEYTASIILCSLLCFFNNFVFSTISTMFNEKTKRKTDLNLTIIDTDFLSSCIRLYFEFVIEEIAQTTSHKDYRFIKNEEEIADNNFINYFDTASVISAANRLVKLLELVEHKVALVGDLESALSKLNLDKRSSSKVDDDTFELNFAESLNYSDNDGGEEHCCNFQAIFKRSSIFTTNASDIVTFLKCLKEFSKCDLDKIIARKEFTCQFLESLIKGLNKNYCHLQDLYKKEAIEAVAIFISNTLDCEPVKNLVDLWFTLLLKLLLRQHLYEGRFYPIEKRAFELLYRSIKNNTKFLDFDDANQRLQSNFQKYLTEITETAQSGYQYKNVAFCRDMCVYLIVMLAEHIPSVFDSREEFFKLNQVFINNIQAMNLESIIDAPDHVGFLPLYETYSYLSFVLTSFSDGYCKRNTLVEGESIQLALWFQDLSNRATLTERTQTPKNIIISYIFTIRAVLKFLDVAIQRKLIVWKDNGLTNNTRLGVESGLIVFTRKDFI